MDQILTGHERHIFVLRIEHGRFGVDAGRQVRVPVEPTCLPASHQESVLLGKLVDAALGLVDFGAQER